MREIHVAEQPTAELSSDSLSVYCLSSAVEATLREEDTQPSRIDILKVNSSEPTPPPVPTTPRPRPPVPHSSVGTNEDPPIPARPSSKPHPSHSQFHRALPTPPPVSRTKEMEFGGHSNSKPAGSPPLPPHRPSSPHTENHPRVSYILRSVWSLPLAKNALHSSTSILYLKSIRVQLPTEVVAVA